MTFFLLSSGASEWASEQTNECSGVIFQWYSITTGSVVLEIPVEGSRPFYAKSSRVHSKLSFLLRTHALFNLHSLAYLAIWSLFSCLSVLLMYLHTKFCANRARHSRVTRWDTNSMEGGIRHRLWKCTKPMHIFKWPWLRFPLAYRAEISEGRPSCCPLSAHQVLYM